MIVTPIKTHKITLKDKDITAVLDSYITDLKDSSIVAITSKIVAICEGRVAKAGEVDKDELVKKEAEYYLPKEENKHGFFLTIKNNIIIASAGIDESNGNGYYILWPKNPQESANKIRGYLKNKFGLKNLGIIITDSRLAPLRWGVIGVSLAHSGFLALNNYIGEPDIFGNNLKVTKANIADGLAVAAVLVMGEGKEQTPIVSVEDIPFVEFQDRNPSVEELNNLRIPMEEDVFNSMLLSVNWQKGEGK